VAKLLSLPHPNKAKIGPRRRDTDPVLAESLLQGQLKRIGYVSCNVRTVGGIVKPHKP
jgi:hypothetical protein